MYGWKKQFHKRINAKWKRQRNLSFQLLLDHPFLSNAIVERLQMFGVSEWVRNKKADTTDSAAVVHVMLPQMLARSKTNELKAVLSTRLIGKYAQKRKILCNLSTIIIMIIISRFYLFLFRHYFNDMVKLLDFFPFFFSSSSVCYWCTFQYERIK